VPMSGARQETDRMNMGLIIAGRDAVAVDTTCALITGWDPESIGYLNHFRAHGIGSATVPEILVAGKKVADIRKFFTIKIPSLGGTPVEQKDAPALDILDFSVDGGVLSISTQCSEDTAKMEVYIDKQFYASVSGKDKMGRIEIDTAGIKGDYTVTVVAYDRFLYYSEASFEAEF